MKRDQVRIGATYAVMVSGRLSCVRITKDNGMSYRSFSGRMTHGGWEGINLRTKKTVFIRSAARLRREVLPAEPVCAK